MYPLKNWLSTFVTLNSTTLKLEVPDLLVQLSFSLAMTRTTVSNFTQLIPQAIMLDGKQLLLVQTMWLPIPSSNKSTNKDLLLKKVMALL